MKVFWSWQNDYEPKICRHFIREALIEAIHLAADNLGLEDAERPEVDHDTKGAPGMVDIVATVLNKISQSAVFVADLTPISKTAAGKALPNPNVMLELGWALSKLGPERIIPILNTATGYKPDDLPFDIRQRRMMTYELEITADSKKRASVKKELITSLGEALRKNLGDHLDAKVAAQDIQGVAANPSNPSIWASATDEIEFVDPLDPGRTKSISFPNRPRGYIRIIPAGWKNGPPNVSEISRLPDEVALWPHSSSIDFGTCKEGYVRFDMRRPNGAETTPETHNVVMFFDETGEFWSVSANAVSQASRGLSLRHVALVADWAVALKKTFAVFRKFEAVPTWKAEVGLFGMQGVRWHGSWEDDSPAARKGSFALKRQFRGWVEAEQLAFLVDALSAIHDLFGRPRATADEVRFMLPPEWSKAISLPTSLI
jgi:hypothetical protein